MFTTQITPLKVFFVLLLPLSACENGIVGTGETPNPIKGGYAQKGPFAIGANVIIVSRPGPTYVANKTIQVQTQDGIGSFDYDFEVGTLYDVSVSGNHFNEVTGQMSAKPITLHNTYYHDTNSKSFIAVNILTHLVHLRIDQLVDNGIHPRDAMTQASSELKREIGTEIFPDHLSDFNFNNTTVYNLSESNTEANAVLLFISAAFYQQSVMNQNSVALMEMIDYIANDLQTDGLIEGAASANPGLNSISSLDYAAHQLNPIRISANLTEHAKKTMGKTLSVPNINFLLDNDGDGTNNDFDSDDDGDGFLDDVDNNPYKFEIFLSTQSFTTKQDTAITLDLGFSKPDKDIPHFTIVSFDSQPQYGTVSGNYPNVVYIPEPGFVGSDSFQYHVSYSSRFLLSYTSDKTTVSIEITAP